VLVLLISTPTWSRWATFSGANGSSAGSAGVASTRPSWTGAEPKTSSIATSLSALVLTPVRSMSAASANASISLAFASPAGRAGQLAVELALGGGLAEVAAEDGVVEPLAGDALLLLGRRVDVDELGLVGHGSAPQRVIGATVRDVTPE
jgi:hypothetical protein